MELLRKHTSPVVNVSSIPQRSPFRYPGGKTWFVPTARKWLASLDFRPNLFLEPFAGGGIVGLTVAFENLAKKVQLVEIDPGVAAVWKSILNGDAKRLAKKIVDFDLTVDTARNILDKKPSSTLGVAFQTILRNRVSHGGIMAPGSGLTKSGENGKGIKSRWYPETLAKRILEIEGICEKILFTEDDAFDVIPKVIGSAKNAVFVDPPYTASGKRAGKRLYNFHQLDHNCLFSLFRNSKAEFIFTYDVSNELLSLASKNGFQTVGISMKNTHHATMDELIIGKNLQWLTDH